MHKFALIFCLTSGIASTAVAEGDYENGKKLVKSWDCIACHGLTGNERRPEEPGVKSSPMLAGQPASYLIRTLKEFKTRARIDDHESSNMSARAQALSNKEIENIAVYFAAQKRY